MIPIRDNVPRRSVPVVTILIILANAGVFAFELNLGPQRLQNFIYLFGLVPKRYTHPAWAQWVGFPVDTYWPFFTSMFLHGGFFHILLNMWTLWIFGDNVEDRMGGLRYVAFYLLCGLIAAGVHVVTNAGSQMPVVGASGAIAGVLGAYFVMYPRARLILLIPIFFYPLFFEIPAFLYLILWFLLQLYSGALSLGAETASRGGVAWWAHIGGFAAGVALHRFFLIGRPPPRRMYADEHGLAGPWSR